MHKTSCTYTTDIFENDLLPTMAVQQKQHADAVRCHKILSGLIRMSVFNTGSAKKCIHTLTKENSTLYNRLL